MVDDRTNNIDTPTLFDDVLKISKSASQFGPVRVYRVPEKPADNFGRNGDLCIIDNTAVSSVEIASGKCPTNVGFCQKIPTQVPSGPNRALSTSIGADLVGNDSFTINGNVIILPAGSVFIKDAADVVNSSALPGIIAIGLTTSVPGTVINPTVLPSYQLIINTVVINFPINGGIGYIASQINAASIPFIGVSTLGNKITITHIRGGTITLGGANLVQIMGAPTISGGTMAITNDDGAQVTLADVIGTPLATMGFPLIIPTTLPLVCGGTWQSFDANGIDIKDQGSPLGVFDNIDFMGDGVTVTDLGSGELLVKITGVGLDPKKSVRAGTTGVLTGFGITYNAIGGTGGTGEFINVNLSSIDGTPMVVGDRILVKNQADPKQNGIYVITLIGTLGTIERSPDQDGSPAAEVSAGNFTFVEQGSTLVGSGWVVTGDGILILNTDPIVWTQFSESSIFSAGAGLNLIGSVFSLDINNLSPATISSTDKIGFADILNVQRNTTIANFLADLGIPNNVITDGIIINSAGIYSTISIAVSGAGSLGGLSIVNASGTTGNPTLGLDIQNLPAHAGSIGLTDRVAVYNVTSGTNEYYTIAEVATNSFGVVVGDTGGIATADSPTDSISIIGATNGGIDTVSFSGGIARLSIALDISKLSPIGAGVIVLANTFAIDDGSLSNKVATFKDMVVDLEIPNTIGPAAGFVVSNGFGGYATRIFGGAFVGDELGIVVTPNNGSADTSIGLSIIGLINPIENMAAIDEFVIHNKSEGFGGANRKITGQEIADGISTILGIPSLKSSYLFHHNGTITQTFSLPIIIGFGTSVRADVDYTHILVGGGSEITINKTGWYKITYDVSFEDTTNSRSDSKSRLQVNGVDVAGSVAFAYHRNSNKGFDTGSSTMSIILNLGDVIRVMSEEQAGNTLATVAHGCRLNIESIDSP